jgi:hypothetical protein
MVHHRGTEDTEREMPIDEKISSNQIHDTAFSAD